MSVTVFCWSGTGNSYYIAKNIAEKTKGKLVPIASVIVQREIPIETDCFGIVFPVYYGDAPNIIIKFAEKLKSISSKYVFAVCTYGGGKGDSLKTVKEIMERNGGSIDAAFGIQMPQSTFKKEKQNRDKLFAKADEMIDLICGIITSRKRGYYSSGIVLDILLRPVHRLLRPAYQKHLIKMAEGEKGDQREELIYKLDHTFSVNEKCKGCKACVKVCPVHNIEMTKGMPKWLHHCENCLACFNLCPNNAIETKLVKNGYYYLHPEYSGFEKVL